MKNVANILVLIVVCVYSCKGETYTTKYDNINVQQILSNKRLLNNYVNCLMDRGRCTADAALLKNVLPEALQTDCAKCSPKQKELTKSVIMGLIKQHKATFDELQSKYDPDKTYVKKYSDLLKKEGIVL